MSGYMGILSPRLLAGHAGFIGRSAFHSEQSKNECRKSIEDDDEKRKHDDQMHVSPEHSSADELWCLQPQTKAVEAVQNADRCSTVLAMLSYLICSCL